MNAREREAAPRTTIARGWAFNHGRHRLRVAAENPADAVEAAGARRPAAAGGHGLAITRLAPGPEDGRRQPEEAEGMMHDGGVMGGMMWGMGLVWLLLILLVVLGVAALLKYLFSGR